MAHRFISLVTVLVGITLIAFLLGVASPGDPAEIALSQNGMTSPTPEQIAAMRHSLGLDAPLHVQYLRWLGGVLRGDLGRSYHDGRDVGGELLRRLPITLKLSCYALLFAEVLGWLPTSGVGGFKHMLMPALVLSSATAAGLARLVRANLLAEMGKQYYTAAAARGFGRMALTLRTALPGAVLPAITMIGNYMGGILGGSVVVETLFALPGLGSYAIKAIGARDYPALQGYVLLTGLVFVVITLAVDLICALLDPRIRLGGEAP